MKNSDFLRGTYSWCFFNLDKIVLTCCCCLLHSCYISTDYPCTPAKTQRGSHEICDSSTIKTWPAHCITPWASQYFQIIRISRWRQLSQHPQDAAGSDEIKSYISTSRISLLPWVDETSHLILVVVLYSLSYSDSVRVSLQCLVVTCSSMMIRMGTCLDSSSQEILNTIFRCHGIIGTGTHRVGCAFWLISMASSISLSVRTPAGGFLENTFIFLQNRL